MKKYFSILIVVCILLTASMVNAKGKDMFSVHVSVSCGNKNTKSLTCGESLSIRKRE
jgi:hypothetical protein